MPRIHRKTLLKAVGGLMVVLLVGLGIYLWTIQQRGNFGVVAEGEVYRSNQPTAGQLETYAKTYGIRTVLNLRGAVPDAGWYEEERAATDQLGLKLIDFRMSAGEQLSDQREEELMAILRDAPKPLLIHCKSGSDRTGLASVMYLALQSGVDEDEAERQLSLRYGHFSVPWLSQAWPMDETWERLEAKYGIEEE